jgi:serine/threonine-protein kinase
MTSGELQVGTILQDTYEVIQLIGRGGMGSVWKVTHRRLPGKRFAVKVLLGDSASDPEIYARFQREAEIASRLGHPNIVEVIDFNTLPGGEPYMVMEYLEGESLASRLHHRRTLPLEETFGLVRQIASALLAAHRANVIHRDLKPDNIFLTPIDYDGTTSDRVKVLDFGISKIKDSSTLKTNTSALLGTPQYMSPEQASGKNKEIDARTDQFALGAIVYEMLAGRRAFGGETLAEVVCKVMLEQPESLATLAPHVPARVTAAVERALSKNVNDRFPDLGAFVAELSGRALSVGDRPAVRSDDALARTMAAPTQTPTPVGEMARAAPATTQAPRSRSGLVALAIFVPIVALGMGAFIWRQNQAHPPTSARVLSEPVVTSTTSPAVETPKPPVEPVKPAVESPKPPVEPPKPPVEPTKLHPHEPAKIDTGAKEKDLPPEVAAMLDEAETALQGGQFTAATELAERSLRQRKNTRAYRIKALAYCQMGNLSMVNAIKPKIAPADRKRVAQACAANNVPF